MNNTIQAWCLDCDYGLVTYEDKASEMFVRCVRGGIDTEVDPLDTMLIPGGEFEMGDHHDLGGLEHQSDEIPLHQVSIDSLIHRKNRKPQTINMSNS